MLSHIFEAMSDACDEGGGLGGGVSGDHPAGGLGGGLGGYLSGGVGGGGGGASSRSEAQVALHFAMAKGCVPVPGVNTAFQAREVAAALDWEPDMGAMESLSIAAANLHARRNELPWLRSL